MDVKQDEEQAGGEEGPSDFSMACRRFHTLSGAVPLPDDTHTSGRSGAPGRGPSSSVEVDAHHDRAAE